MITVSISINTGVVYTRTAVNKGIDKKGKDGHIRKIHYYLVDDGSYIEHRPIDGAIVLSKKLLDTIQEPK